MKKINQILRNFIILEFFFIFTGFFLSRAENSFYVYTECCDNPVQTRTELIVSVEPEYDSLFSESDNSEKQTPDFSHSHIGFSTLYKGTLNHYHNYVLHQLNSYKCSFALNHQLIVILQKHNIWHQSSEDPPVLFG